MPYSLAGNPAALTTSATPALAQRTGTRQLAMNPALQGMRGIAILLVLLNHAGVPGFGGGFIGVDLFFVISGYLIGGLLLREQLEKGKVDLWAFYARRMRRLLPACAVVLLVVIVAIPWLFAPMEHAELMSSARASSLYAANLWFASRTTDYFGGHTEANPLLHLWSLAVEEQFYLFWPLLMILFWRWMRGDARRSFWVLILVMGSLSLAACLLVTVLKVQYAFFLTPMRVWEFCAGMLLVAGAARVARWPAHRVSAIGVLAILSLAAATFGLDARFPFPGAWALIPVGAGLGLLLVATHDSRSWIHRMLCNSQLRWLGDCSYSVYLWHWPLLILVALLFPQVPVVATAAAAVLSVVIGWLSYRYIELPFKGPWLRTGSNGKVIAVGLGVCISLAATAHVLGRVDLGAEQARFKEAGVWKTVTATQCLVGFDAVDNPECLFGSVDGKTTVVLFGDSHAMQWFVPLQDIAKRNNWRLFALSKAACPSVDVAVDYYSTRAEYRQCTEWREKMFARIEALKPDVVVLASSSGYGVAPDLWEKGLAATARRLQAHGATVTYIRDTPHLSFHVPVCLARAHWRGDDPARLCAYPQARDALRAAPLVAAEAAAMQTVGAEFLDFSAAVCNQESCPTERDGMILFMDRNHLSEAFSQALAASLEPPLLRIMSTAKPKATVQ